MNTTYMMLAAVTIRFAENVVISKYRLVLGKLTCHSRRSGTATRMNSEIKSAADRCK